MPCRRRTPDSVAERGVARSACGREQRPGCAASPPRSRPPSATSSGRAGAPPAPPRAAAPRTPPAAGRTPGGTLRSWPRAARTPRTRARSERRVDRPPRSPRTARDPCSCDFSRQFPAHLLEPQSHPTFHGTDRHIEHLRDLRVREPAVVRELDHSRLLARQRLERRPHLPGLLAARRLHVGELLGLLALLDPLGAGPPALVDQVAPQCVDRPVVDDPEHPRAHAALLALVADLAAPDRQKRLLDDVLGHRPLAHHPISQRERRAAVTVVEHLEGSRVPALHHVHQLLVCQAREVHVNPYAPLRVPDQRPRRLRMSPDTSCALFSSARSRVAPRFLCCWRARTTTSEAPAAASTPAAPIERAQLRGSFIAPS